jgi:hypothetical protein
VSRALGTLEDKGFVKTNKIGLSKIVAISETKHATLLRKLVLEFGHMPLEELLAGTSLEILSAICNLTPSNRRETAQAASVSERSVALVLEKLKRVGIVQKTASKYDVSPRFQTLREFVTEYRRYLNQRIAQEFASDAVVLWECNAEFIIESQAHQARNGFQLTGVSSFARFGVPLIAVRSYFFYSPSARRLKLEDIILHSLLLPERERTLLPTLLVWRKQRKAMNIQYLERQAERYGATEAVRQIMAYFTSEGQERAAGIPPWDEFVVKAQEYGILRVWERCSLAQISATCSAMQARN